MNVRDDLAGRWLDLMMRMVAKCDVLEKFHLLEKAYNEPHRHYHTFNHIRACLDELSAARMAMQTLVIDSNAIELAIWFHDFVYDPCRDDNEHASAYRAFAFCASSRLVRYARPVKQMILATAHMDARLVPPTQRQFDTDLLLDIDLSVLGQPEGMFDRYETNIRKEYAWVPDAAFNEMRIKVLESFLTRMVIYRTDFFRNRYESRARKNLMRSIARFAALARNAE